MRELLSYSFVIPPTIFIVLCLVGSAIGLARPRTGIIIALVSASTLYLCATPMVSTFLIGQLEGLVPSTGELAGAQAIVVLGGDEQRVLGTGDGEVVGPLTLERLALAAKLYRQTGLPILVSGGTLTGSKIPLARLMQVELSQNFAIPVTWVEGESQNTFQNALFSAKILQNDKINSAIIVTNAWHMPRALLSFKQTGLHAIPYCPFYINDSFTMSDIFPTTTAFNRSFYAFHELIGLAYYVLVY